ncbi:hypothetical protein CCR75_001656 [Bremia lactucae]|uniref:Mis18 domain-containing protein n=1 Tax=Bremia lactucae TaxID=4779 RepID=A0A976FPP8_BRELC|nr:hypothetical protein CCR75_001656 [Bremia lactucae]
MNSRKRSYTGIAEGIGTTHSSPYRRTRELVTPQTVPHTSISVRDYSKHRSHEVTNPESEEVEEEEVFEEELREVPSQDTDDGEVGAMPLVVFQCSTCRSIFGDSYAFLCSTEQLWLITLSHVTNVTLAPEVQTANTGFDAGSSYYELLCRNCQAILGRQYLTTPVALDGIRDLFSFSTEAITSYTLGDPMQKGGGGEDEHMKQAAALCHTTMQKLAADQSEVLQLREEMEKVKGLMVAVDNRLAHLEKIAPECEPNPQHPEHERGQKSTIRPHNRKFKI